VGVKKLIILVMAVLKKSAYILIVLILFGIGGFSACSNSSTYIGIEGTIKYIDLEGGFYGIVADNGKNYDPVNLESEYQVDGLRIRVQAIPVTGIATVHQWGTTVKIIAIRESTTHC